mmetsp:Transcript_27613/g.108226  ORF Transcript_27613/g.108226 Transcript_27613/m.108226 type:complete len:253 (-) Transcript_27613:3008-3766(-)|eukprot:CAMPEP_0113954314 /NCGR_PEP_ID=MMETSP0011_2-20120614/445_1 /TAXON_ID=101924 /ORGANISM="Rhodosorus marinus" /LENGTH=252 /DNA_ID=CAMNT_0000963351 /DNA_START=403 /DNA_END=1161 /DNA_ORIENTATION=+ /assembly_acc=CAM_ASM_000156
MRSFQSAWDLDDPREAIATHTNGVKWFLMFGVRLDELGVRVDRDLAASSDPNIKVASDPRQMEFTIQGDIQGLGDVSVRYNPLKNLARVRARLYYSAMRLFTASNLEGLNVTPRPKHTDEIGIQLRDISPFKTKLLQRLGIKYNLQSGDIKTKVVLRHKRLNLRGEYDPEEGLITQAGVHVWRKQLISYAWKDYSSELRWRSVDSDQPFSVSLEVPYKGSWEDRLDETVLTLRKKFVIDGMRIFEEMTRIQN